VAKASAKGFTDIVHLLMEHAEYFNNKLHGESATTAAAQSPPAHDAYKS
jgi:hypothetical protein